MSFSFDGQLTPKNTDSEPIETNIIILGGGPAGYTAAIYAARAELAPVVLSGPSDGGQAALTDKIENYPGFPEGVNGYELVANFRQQAEQFGAQINGDMALSVAVLPDGRFHVKGYSGEYIAKALIIATGATHKLLDVPGEKELTGRGVSYCGTCDGWFFKNKDIVVVGGGDSALEEGLFLTRFARSVNIIHRRDTLRASRILQKRAFENEKIRFTWNTVVTEIVGDEKVTAIKTKNLLTGEKGELPIDGVFIFIGHTPNTQFLKGIVEMDELGYLLVDRHMQTSVPGIFAAGEAADPLYRQVITSAGMGAAAAMQAVHYLSKE